MLSPANVADPGGFTASVADADCVGDKVAVILTVRLTVTKIVVMVNVAEFCPDGMFTENGAWAMVGLSDCKLTFTPASGAGLPMVTVPLTLFPPITELLVKVTCRAGATMSCAVSLILPRVAVRLAVSAAVTTEVGIEKVVELLLKGTVTLAGGCAAALSLASAIFDPPAGALPFNTTVPKALSPPCTLEGATVKAASCNAPGGSISRVAVSVTPPACAVIVAVSTVVTVAEVAMENCADACPAGIVTDSGS